MDRGQAGALLGFVVGSAALWAFRSVPPAAPSAEPETRVAARPVAALKAPPKVNPHYPGSLDLFADTNRRSAQGLTDTGDSLPRVREGAVIPVEPKPAAEEPPPAVLDAPRPDDAAKPAAPGPEPSSFLESMLLRSVGLGTFLLVLLGAAIPAGGRGAARSLLWSTAAAALALGVLALRSRLGGEGPESLFWAGFSVFSLFLTSSRLRSQSPV